MILAHPIGKAVIGSVKTEDDTSISFIDVKAEANGLGAYIRFRPGEISLVDSTEWLHVYKGGVPSRVVAVELLYGVDVTIQQFRNLMQPRLTEKHVQTIWRKLKKLKSYAPAD
jgi:hypothetical protein